MGHQRRRVWRRHHDHQASRDGAAQRTPSREGRCPAGRAPAPRPWAPMPTMWRCQGCGPHGLVHIRGLVYAGRRHHHNPATLLRRYGCAPGEATSLRSSIAAAVARRCARRQAEGRPNERRCIHLSRGTCAPGRRAERLLRATRSLEAYIYFYFSTKSVDSPLTEGFTLHLRGRGALERAPCPANCTPPLSGCLRHPE